MTSRRFYEGLAAVLGAGIATAVLTVVYRLFGRRLADLGDLLRGGVK